MATNRFPAYLRMLGPVNPTGRTASTGPREGERLRPGELDPQTGLATRQALLDRLEAIGTLAPSAPLSFIVVKVGGLARSDENEDQLRWVAKRLAELVRATDVAGRLSGTAFGVALQGTGLAAASAVAARLTHHLNRIPDLHPGLCIAVSAATGTGVNADTLPAAAMDTYEPCCG